MSVHNQQTLFRPPSDAGDRRAQPGSEKAHPSRPRLTAAEREIVLTIADDEETWHIYTDSRRLRGRLLRVAARWGATPEPLGAGIEFRLPLEAVRFSGPRGRKRLTEAQKAHLARGRASRQKALLGSEALANSKVSAESGPPGVS